MKMLVSLNSVPRKLAFAMICLGAFATYATSIVRHYIAYRLVARVDRQSQEQAAEIEPGNAEAQWRLGRYLLYLFQDPHAAVPRLEAAVALNPYVAQYWLDLATSYQVLGELPKQRQALERGLSAEPTAAEVTWQIANFYLAEGDVTRALPLLRIVIENDPIKVHAALELCWRATKDVQAILDQALPPGNSSVYFALLDLLMKQGQASEAAAVWTQLESSKQTFPITDAFPYFDYLLKRGATDSAVEIWKGLLNRSSELAGCVEPPNLIVNGGLEKNLLNGGFDWRYEMRDSVTLSLDTRDFHGGNQSLRFDFTGPAVADIGFFQYVPVRPNTNYRFSAYTKAQDIDTASGPRLVIVDAHTGSQYVASDDLLGTTGWRQQWAEFRTSENTSMLIVKVARIPGDALIKGTLWIDDIALVQR